MCKNLIHLIAPMLLLCVATGVSNADLIAYWPLDEGTGNVAADIVGGFDGQITGGTWYQPGKVGAAAYQGSGGNSINCGPDPSPKTKDLTLAWWMIDNHPSYGTIMNKSVTDSGYGYNILVRPPDEDSPLRFRIGGWQSYGGWGEECRLPSGAYNDGEWVHIVCTYDSATDTASIYVNGHLPENGTYNPKTGIAGPGCYCAGVNNLETPLFIRGGVEGFDGVLDEVAIWDQALTADEVMTVYKLGPTALDGSQSFALEIESSGSDLVFAWESQAGMFYNLKTSTDLAAGLSTWDLVEVGGVFDIPAAPPTNTHTIARPGDPIRFYRVEEFPLPPVILLSEDFETNDGGFTNSNKGTGSIWEHGDPDSSGGGGDVLTGNGGSGQCWGTDIGNPGIYAPGTDACLRSPVIDLTGVTEATLSFAQAIDIENGTVPAHTLVVNVIDDTSDTVIEAAIHTSTPDGNIGAANWETVDSIAISGAALGQPVRIEWRFTGDARVGSDYIGAYIDDVEVTTPAP